MGYLTRMLIEKKWRENGRKDALRLARQPRPEGVAVEDLMARAQAHRDVRDLHHLHLWTTDGTEVFLEAHVTLKEQARDRTDRVLEELSRILREDFAIAHVTLQLEFSRCAGDRCSGMDAIHAHHNPHDEEVHP